MKRALATIGVAGLAWVSVSAPAYADADFKICHHGRELWIDLNGGNALAGHTQHDDDIIPPNALLPGGLNWDEQGMADYANSCVPVTLSPLIDPPVGVEPPVVIEPPVVADPPVEAQVPVTTAPTVQTPVAPATVQTPAGAAALVVSQGTNKGFNAQTAAGGTDSAATWLAGLGVMLGAGAVVAVRRRFRKPQAG